MTMLTATSRMVVRNMIRSDLSFRAIRVYKAGPHIARHTVSGQQSSVGLGQRHQLHRPGQPVFPAASPRPLRPTDDSSPLTVPTHVGPVFRPGVYLSTAQLLP